MEFPIPKFREMTHEEASNLHLINGENNYTSSSVPVGEFLKPTFQSVCEVWATYIQEDTMTYRIYNLGTNYIKVTRYVPIEDKWEEINPADIHDLNGLFYRLIVRAF